MRPIDQIIDRFGGLNKLASALGHRHPTTVQGWKARGSVPVWQIPKVIEAAALLGIELTHADFFTPSATSAAE